jgi:hypothetical protein
LKGKRELRFNERDKEESGMWTMENRARYDRGALCYPSDVTEEEWTEIALLIPPPAAAGASAASIFARCSTGCSMC